MALIGSGIFPDELRAAVIHYRALFEELMQATPVVILKAASSVANELLQTENRTLNRGALCCCAVACAIARRYCPVGSF